MKLFFETAAQARAFLAMLPLGIFLAVCYDLASAAKGSRPFWDVLLMLLCGLGVALFLLWTKADGLRLYHLLALCMGCILYFRGIGALLRVAIRKIRSLKAEK